VAISCYGSNCTTEIATLPSVARDDAVLRQTLSAQDYDLHCLEQLAFETAFPHLPPTLYRAMNSNAPISVW